MSSLEKVYVLGPTGNIGTKLVKNLLSQGVSTTIYVRNVEKSQHLFGDNPLLTTVHGDIDDLSSFRSTVSGHTRLFILLTHLPQLAQIKTEIAETAFASGIQQIVDISSRFVDIAWRTSVIGENARLAEKRLYALAREFNRSVVSLRPSSFFSNHLAEAETIRSQGIIIGHRPLDVKAEYISTDDIADVASLILTDPVETHGNRAYVLIGDSVDGPTRAALFSKALGTQVKYKQVSPLEYYETLMQMGYPKHLSYDIATVKTEDLPNQVVPILLRRPYETLESWIFKNKTLFQ